MVDGHFVESWAQGGDCELKAFFATVAIGQARTVKGQALSAAVQRLAQIRKAARADWNSTHSELQRQEKSLEIGAIAIEAALEDIKELE